MKNEEEQKIKNDDKPKIIQDYNVIRLPYPKQIIESEDPPIIEESGPIESPKKMSKQSSSL